MTLLYLGGAPASAAGPGGQELHERLLALEGSLVTISIVAVCVDRSLGLVSLRVAVSAPGKRTAINFTACPCVFTASLPFTAFHCLKLSMTVPNRRD